MFDDNGSLVAEPDSEIVQTEDESPDASLTTLMPDPDPGTSIVRVEQPYVAPGTALVTEKQIEILMAPPKDDEIMIRPDGIVYYPGVLIRRRLLQAFGPGGWSLVPLRDPWVDQNDHRVYLRAALFVGGRFVSEAVGGHVYQEKNANGSWDDALESAKTNALTRCCKDLGIASELWDHKFVEDWKQRHAIGVWCEGQPGTNVAGKKKRLWRLKSAPKIDAYPWKEQGAASQQEAAEEPAKASSKKQAAKSKPAEPATPAKPDMTRPWSAQVCAGALQAKARKLQKDFDEKGQPSTITEETLDNVIQALEVIWPNETYEVGEQVLTFLFSRGDRTGLTEAEATALLTWFHETDPETMRTEARNVLWHVLGRK